MTASDPDSTTWTIHCDGSAVPNPGRMGIGAVMVDPHGQRHVLSKATHAVGCNNEAELRALMAALQALKSWQATSLQVYSDNSVLVEQLTVLGCKPVVRLAPLFDEARALLASFAHVSLRWIPRHRNGEADALARVALGLPLAAPPSPSLKRQKKRRR
ncbi:ribonuclease HI family protein [Aquabacterium sp.]|uniref:ribonuclease HI family protein n=1 Tax=Aquabacterium sp. TaxID=1872578 RepID=UPI003D6CF495